MKVLVVEPQKVPYVKEIEEGLDSLQKEVDGYIQTVYPWEEPCAIVCDDEAKLKGKMFNRSLRDEDNQIYDIVAGTFLIVGLGEETFTSLSDAYVELFKEKFAVPEMFVRVEGSLLVIPMDMIEDKG